MNKISEITRLDIIDIFKKGDTIVDGFGDQQMIFYPYYGRLEELKFLKKIYQLENMPSSDHRFKNLEEDIYQHTVINNDWPDGWFFDDERFNFKTGSDITLLKFLCAVFHPENRKEYDSHWKLYFDKINKLIKCDGYELYESCKISKRSVYSWRKLTKEEQVSNRFLPFSQRNKSAIEKKIITPPSISKKIRFDLYSLISQYDKPIYRTEEGGWNYTLTLEKAIFEDIKSYYIPKAFVGSNIYEETDDFKTFVMCNYPSCVLDIIELVARISTLEDLSNELNLVLQNNKYSYILKGGKIEQEDMCLQTKEEINEMGLKDLIEQAQCLYASKTLSEKRLAVEKLWDAFERLKTYYTHLDKKKSSSKIIEDISSANDKFKELLDEEFNKLTKIGVIGNFVSSFFSKVV